MRHYVPPPPPMPKSVYQRKEARAMREAMLRGGSTFTNTVAAIELAFPELHPETLEELNPKPVLFESPDPFKNTKPMFDNVSGEPEITFAWLPVKTFDDRWVWMRQVWFRTCVSKSHLIDGAKAGIPWRQYAKVTNR